MKNGITPPRAVAAAAQDADPGTALVVGSLGSRPPRCGTARGKWRCAYDLNHEGPCEARDGETTREQRLHESTLCAIEHLESGRVMRELSTLSHHAYGHQDATPRNTGSAHPVPTRARSSS